MSKYYKPHRSSEWNYGGKNFRLSRSKIDLFLECPRCFYLDAKLGVSQPPSFPLTLNIAVDELLKKEFDIHRAKGTKHPFMESYGIDAVPFRHENMDKWRDSLREGIQYVHPETGFSIRGGIDDIWINSKGQLHVVDYKATSKKTEVNLEGDLGRQYKRQMEVYQWLLRKNGFNVSSLGYFVYVNADKDAKAFDKKLEFNVVILPCEGNDAWVEPTLLDIKETLSSNEIPKRGVDCEFCDYREAAEKAMSKLKSRNRSRGESKKLF